MRAPAVLISLGAAGLAFSLFELFSGAAWIKPFFYLFAWWSYLACVEGGLGPASMLLAEPRRYLRLCLVSIPFWLLYEALNLRLRNWEYWDLPRPLPVRWAGYALAFATVLPAVVETAALLRRLMKTRLAWRPVFPRPPARITGWSCLILALAWPRVFFPLAWAPAWLLLEDDASETGRLDYGALLFSGALCGLLWEFFNYWAGAKWKYTVPWPRGPRFFEMPLLGYAGFLPFALGCGSFRDFFDSRWTRARPESRKAAVLALALFSAATLYAIDRWTVRSLV